MISGSKLLGCRSSLSALRSTRSLIPGSKATLFNTKREFTQTPLSVVNHRPQYTKIAPLVLGGIRQHGSHGHHHDADLMNSLTSSSKRGTRITVIGLVSNVGLTVTKGVAGWYVMSCHKVVLYF